MVSIFLYAMHSDRYMRPHARTRVYAFACVSVLKERVLHGLEHKIRGEGKS